MAKSRIGILGGGQLARMLALSGHPLGFSLSVFATHAADPAPQVCGQYRLGSLSDEAELRKFLQNDLDFATFESEFVDTTLLARCLPSQVKVFPSLPVIEMIQDRLTQKRLLDRLKIPTSPWLEVSTAADLKQARARFPKGFVLKQRRFGYDGYGTFIYKNPKADVDPAILQKSNSGFIAEGLVHFKRELAISFVRSTRGEFVVLPLVESVQKNARCFSVHGPLPATRLKKMTLAFKKLMVDLDYHGILAVELFDSADGLLVNELAPRVHNSAHYTLDALTCDQFEYHLRAGLGLPLPKVTLRRPGFAMVNLLGEGRSEIGLNFSGAGKLHWYGKNENRAGRKLGHINVLDQSGVKALKRALKWRKDFQL